MQRMVGRAAGGEQGDDTIDDGAFVDHLSHRRVLRPHAGDLDRALCRSGSERIPQRRVRRDEGRARHVQAHDFHQHLIAVGGAVERAGAGVVIRLRFGFQQLFAADLALRVKLAGLGFLAVRQPGRHRAGGNEDGRQMTEVQRADQEPRHDLVADTQIDGGVEHVVRQCDGSGHGDRVA